MSIKRHIDALDGLRGIAILAVLLFHTLGAVFGYVEPPWDGFLRDLSGPDSFIYFLPFSFGQIGVPIFFVVSGFCIHWTFQQQRQQWRSFFTRRFFRIYPPYLAAAIFCVALLAAHTGPDVRSLVVWRVWLTHLFLAHNFDPISFSSLNGSFWSLAIEAQLYLIYPALLFLINKAGWRRTMISLAIVEAACRLSGVWILTVSPLAYWFSWSIGAYVADAILKDRPVPARTRPALWVFLMVGSYFIKPIYPLMFPLAAVATAALLCHWINTSVRISAPLKAIGLWSYSIYLLHEPLLNFYANALAAVVPQQYRSAFLMFALILATWAAIIPFSVLWYKLFELPSIAWGKRIIGRVNTHDATTFEPERFQELRRTRSGAAFAMGAALLCLAAGSGWVSYKFTPDPPEQNNNRAWALATNPDPAKRNGDLAVKLAEDACRRTQYRVTTIVGTLAACYAEDGRFNDAVAAAQKAMALAAKNNETNLYQRNLELLKLYQSHQPYRETN